MILRFLILLPLPFCLLSCSVIMSRPVYKNAETRFKEFPTAGMPLQATVQIRWNEYLIPFIKAETDSDCAFVLGMVHAHLRLGQMSVLREAANYRLAEHVGPIAVKVEQTLRTMQITAAADSIYAILPDETLNWLSAFVDGVNWYQDQIQDLPVEMRLLKIKPDKWTVLDVLKIGRVVAADVNWFSLFGLAALQKNPHYAEYAELMQKFGGGKTSSFMASNALDEFFTHYSKSGSNAFALSADKTELKSAVMVTDPHLGLQLPNFWLLAGYKCPSYHVLGMMVPGIPIVMQGRNQDIAWSGTNMRAASSDVFELTPDETAQITSQKQKIKVRWWFDRSFTLRNSPLGPVISDAPYVKSDDKTFVLRWVGHQPSDEMSALLKVNRAADWNEFRSAFSTYAVSGQNFLYANNKGQIGLVPAVKIPQRTYKTLPWSILSPLPENRWLGFLTASELPFIFNPAEGFVASSNNNPLEASTPLGFNFASDDRILRLQQVLSQDRKVDMQTIKELQYDTFSISALNAAKTMHTVLMNMNDTDFTPTEKQLLQTLSNWNGRYDSDAKAPVIFQMLLYNFVTDYYSKKWDKKLANRLLNSDMINEIADFVLQDSDTTAPASLRLALQKTAAKHHKYKNWGDMHRLSFTHLLGRLPIVGKRFRFGEAPIGGSYNTLMKTSHSVTDKISQSTYGANARYISVLNDTRQNYFVLLGGQDGWLDSPSSRDQIPLWLNNEYIRIPFDWQDVEQEFDRLMLLTP